MNPLVIPVGQPASIDLCVDDVRIAVYFCGIWNTPIYNELAKVRCIATYAGPLPPTLAYYPLVGVHHV